MCTYRCHCHGSSHCCLALFCITSSFMAAQLRDKQTSMLRMIVLVPDSVHSIVRAIGTRGAAANDQRGAFLPSSSVNLHRWLRSVADRIASLTTVLGLVPMALGGGALFEPMATLMLGGLLLASPLTLLFVPAAYRLLFKRREAMAAPLKTSESMS